MLTQVNLLLFALEERNGTAKTGCPAGRGLCLAPVGPKMNGD
jgi:hypothetical protein